jgi:hypothetical protein
LVSFSHGRIFVAGAIANQMWFVGRLPQAKGAAFGKMLQHHVNAPISKWCNGRNKIVARGGAKT